MVSERQTAKRALEGTLWTFLNLIRLDAPDSIIGMHGPLILRRLEAYTGAPAPDALPAYPEPTPAEREQAARDRTNLDLLIEEVEIDDDLRRANFRAARRSVADFRDLTLRLHGVAHSEDGMEALGDLARVMLVSLQALSDGRTGALAARVETFR